MALLLALSQAVAGTAIAQAPTATAGAQTQPATQAAPTQAAPSKSFLPQRSAAAKAEAPPSGLLAGLYFWLADQQRQFIAKLAATLRDIKSGNAVLASLVLIGFSFAYGVLHAAGPGHGKAVVSSYILADGQTVRRGVQLAFLSSFVQALSALTIFTVVMFIAGSVGPRAQIASAEAWIERVSWAIVAAFGAWLLFRQLRALMTGRPVHDHAHHAHDHHGHGHGHTGHGHAHQADAKHSHDHHGHAHHDHKHTQAQAHHEHHHHEGDNCAHCGHAHMPSAAAVAGDWSWKRAGAMAFAVGVRPCTGAIGVLFVAKGLGLLWAGVVSTFAMSIGTALTVSALAALAAGSRDMASRLAGVADNSWAARTQTAFGLAGAALVFVLGSTFFYYALTTTTPF